MTLVYNDISAAAANTVALNALLASQKVVQLGEGELFHDNTILPSQRGNKLRSPGAGALKLTNTNGAAHSISTPVAGLVDLEISGFEIGWAPNVTVQGGTCGINCEVLEYPEILNNRVEGASIGIALRSTGYGHFKGNVVNACKNVGVYLTQSPNYPQVQWIVEDNIAQVNLSHGFMVYANPALPITGINLGDWINNRTFGNKGQGMAFIGTAAIPIHGVRLYGGFIGGDGNGEIYMDTHGTGHVIRNVYVELSQAGGGLAISANQGTVDVSDSVFTGMAGDGVYCAAKDATFVGVRSVNNGVAAAGGVGFRLVDGKNAMLTGCVTSGNKNGALAIGVNSSSLSGGGNKLL